MITPIFHPKTINPLSFASWTVVQPQHILWHGYWSGQHIVMFFLLYYYYYCFVVWNENFNKAISGIQIYRLQSLWVYKCVSSQGPTRTNVWALRVLVVTCKSLPGLQTLWNSCPPVFSTKFTNWLLARILNTVGWLFKIEGWDLSCPRMAQWHSLCLGNAAAPTLTWASSRKKCTSSSQWTKNM